MSGIGTYLFFSGSCCRWGLAPPCFETFRDPTVLTIWRPQNNSVKSRTFPMNSINEIHEAGLGKYGCDSKYRNPSLWSLKDEICWLKVLIYFDLLQETNCTHDGALKFKWEIKLLPLEVILGHDETWSDMWIWVMRLCFSNEKSSLRCRICFFLRMFIRSFIAECTDTWQVQATCPFFTRYFWNNYPIWWFTLVVQTRWKYTFIIQLVGWQIAPQLFWGVLNFFGELPQAPSIRWKTSGEPQVFFAYHQHGYPQKKHGLESSHGSGTCAEKDRMKPERVGCRHSMFHHVIRRHWWFAGCLSCSLNEEGLLVLFLMILGQVILLIYSCLLVGWCVEICSISWRTLRGS